MDIGEYRLTGDEEITAGRGGWHGVAEAQFEKIRAGLAELQVWSHRGAAPIAGDGDFVVSKISGWGHSGVTPGPYADWVPDFQPPVDMHEQAASNGYG